LRHFNSNGFTAKYIDFFKTHFFLDVTQIAFFKKEILQKLQNNKQQGVS
jgi:hypothetical protein